jgi:hypothetical protein
MPLQARGPKAYSDIDITQAMATLRDGAHRDWWLAAESLKKAANHTDISEAELKVVNAVRAIVEGVREAYDPSVVGGALADLLSPIAIAIHDREKEYGFGYLRK